MRDKILKKIKASLKILYSLLAKLLNIITSPITFMIIFYILGGFFISSGLKEYFGIHAQQFGKGTFFLFASYYLYKGLKR